MAKSKNRQKKKKQQALERKLKRNRRILCVCIAVFAVFVLFVFVALKHAGLVSKKGVAYSGTVQFGVYPQTMVSDDALLSELSEKELHWRYYDDCFSGTDFYGMMAPDSCMKYADVEYGGNKYRAVMIERYRPQTIISPATAEESFQDDNGFFLNRIYWFRFEPIEWVVFNSKKGFVLTRCVLDAAPFNDAVYWIDRNIDGVPDPGKELSLDATFFVPLNLYKTSSIRKWLNGRFFDDAFSPEEQKQVKRTVHRADEKAWRNKYGLLSLNYDKIFLPSLRSIAYDTNVWDGYYTAVGEEVQFVPVTDYARCRGVYAEESENCFYTWEWLCTPGDGCADVISTNTDVRLINVDRQFYYSYTLGGIRCAAFFKRLGDMPMTY